MKNAKNYIIALDININNLFFYYIYNTV